MDAIITVLASLTALFAVVLAPLVSMYVVRKEINAQVVSTNRQAWINRLRDELAGFIRDVRNLPSAYAAETITLNEAVARYEAMQLKLEVVRLLLNPTEADHQALLVVMGEASESTLLGINERVGMAKTQTALAEKVVVAAQPILKAEWIRVKTGE